MNQARYHVDEDERIQQDCKADQEESECQAGRNHGSHLPDVA